MNLNEVFEKEAFELRLVALELKDLATSLMRTYQTTLGGEINHHSIRIIDSINNIGKAITDELSLQTMESYNKAGQLLNILIEKEHHGSD